MGCTALLEIIASAVDYDGVLAEPRCSRTLSTHPPTEAVFTPAWLIFLWVLVELVQCRLKDQAGANVSKALAVI